MHDAKPRMRCSEFVEDTAGRVIRTIVDSDDFKIRIIDFHECRERGRKFFFFIARRKKNRDARAFRIRSRRKILDPRELGCAVSNADAVGKPEKCDKTKKCESEKMHGNWCQR